MGVLLPLHPSLSASLHSPSRLDQSSPGVIFSTCAYAQPCKSTRRIQTRNAPPPNAPIATNTVATASTSGVYVQAAKTWNLVKPQAFLELKPTVLDGADISRAFWGEMKGGTLIPEGGVKCEVEVTADMLRERNFEKLEHITVKV
ncbi:pheromone processing endoprotease [Ceratobasidium sp. 428]|nr:pheromone processing endoprotease [Ceratobasidium sp. 428]